MSEHSELIIEGYLSARKTTSQPNMYKQITRISMTKRSRICNERSYLFFLFVWSCDWRSLSQTPHIYFFPSHLHPSVFGKSRLAFGICMLPSGFQLATTQALVLLALLWFRSQQFPLRTWNSNQSDLDISDRSYFRNFRSIISEIPSQSPG